MYIDIYIYTLILLMSSSVKFVCLCKGISSLILLMAAESLAPITWNDSYVKAY